MRWHGRGTWVAMHVQVSTELIRMAILWHEQWHEALEEASRLYFGDSNVQGMLAILSPLHRKMQDAGPTTLKEIAFVSVRTHTHRPHPAGRVVCYKFAAGVACLVDVMCLPRAWWA